MKIVELNPIFCPKLNKEIPKEACWETQDGTLNVLEEIGVDKRTAMRVICPKCEVGKQEATVKRVIKA